MTIQLSILPEHLKSFWGPRFVNKTFSNLACGCFSGQGGHFLQTHLTTPLGLIELPGGFYNRTSQIKYIGKYLSTPVSSSWFPLLGFLDGIQRLDQEINVEIRFGIGFIHNKLM